MTKERSDRLIEYLTWLKLTKTAEVVQDELDEAARTGRGAGEVLERLLVTEVQARVERRVERRIIQSKLVERKLLGDFDFVFQTGVDKGQIMELASMRFIERKLSLLIAGNSGTGKSHIAKALLLLACQRQWRCLYTTSTAMLKDLIASLSDDSLDEKLKTYLNCEILLIDEVGFDRLEQESHRNASLFYKVINGRYTKNVPTIMTTNVDFKELGDYLGDPLITTTIVDRLVHHAIILNVIGPSYRAYQSELLNKSEKPETGAPPEATRDAPPPPEASPRDHEAKTPRRKSPRRNKHEKGDLNP